MEYYAIAVLAAKSSVNNVCYLVDICNENQDAQCGIRKVTAIPPSYPNYKYALDTIQAVSNTLPTDTCISIPLDKPMPLGDCNIETRKIPQIKDLKDDSVQQIGCNNVLRVGAKFSNEELEKRCWEKDLSDDYDLNIYSLKLFGNFTYGSIEYNINAINSSLKQMRTDFDNKYKNYINAPIYKQSEYTIGIKKCNEKESDLEEDSVWIVYPEIGVKKKVECNYIEDFKWGLAIAEKNGFKGIIDIGGNFIVPCEYEEILPLRLFKQDRNTCEESEIEEYDKNWNSDNYIQTFIQNSDGFWANITIDNWDDRHWDSQPYFYDFKIEKLFHHDDKDYMVALISREYAEHTFYDDEDEFDSLYRLALAFHNGLVDDYRGEAIDDIIDVAEGKYIVAKKNTFYRPKIGLFEVRENKYDYPYFFIRRKLDMADDFKEIRYVGNDIFVITFHETYQMEKYCQYLPIYGAQNEAYSGVWR